MIQIDPDSPCEKGDGEQEAMTIEALLSNDRPSVIVRLFGGLGNQMFQYAMARALAARNGCPLLLEAKSGFARDAYRRKYGLDAFTIEECHAPHQPSYVGISGRIRRNVAYWINRGLSFERRWYFREKFAAFDQRFLGLHPSHSVYLDGYWQAERYFSDEADRIRADFRFRGPHDPRSEAIAREIAGAGDDAVAVHLRLLRGAPELSGRTDWNPAVLLHNSVGGQYYTSSLAFVRKRVPNARFFVFSDLGEPVRQVVSELSDATFVTHNSTTSASEDLWLMSLCRHAVTSNSTFSWWGAWLAKWPGQVVCAPSRGPENSIPPAAEGWSVI